MTTFNELGLADALVRALGEEGYETPTPIQFQTIPLALAGRDVVGIAQTGTGKTAAFALPILHSLAKAGQRPERKTCRVLVLSPTRELSGQILDSFRTYGRHLKFSATLAIGGVPMGRQIRALAPGVDVLVATPGRLLDLVRSNAVVLNRIEHLVLDEADRMLDMGFIHDIRKIVALVPPKRQTLFFSATMPPAIAELAAAMLRDPARVAVTPVASTAERIAQRVIHVPKAGKAAALIETLSAEKIDRALVFSRTKHGADKLVTVLERAGIASAAIHGNKSQNQRERVLGAFRTGELRLLVATDIAARGIDVEGVSHVFNFDLPNEPESYVHRIGRTARAGAEGVAISFCAPDERGYLRAIERLTKQTIPATGDAPALRAADQPAPRRDRPAGHTQGKGQPQGQQQPNRHKKPHRKGPRPARAEAGGASRPEEGMSGVAFMQHRR